MDHRVRLYQMPNGAIEKATLPKVIRKEGLFTSSMTAFVGYLKAFCHMSYSTIAELFNDVIELSISQIYLVKYCDKKLSPSLILAYSEALEYIRTAPIVGTDETGHKNSGNTNWRGINMQTMLCFSGFVTRVVQRSCLKTWAKISRQFC